MAGDSLEELLKVYAGALAVRRLLPYQKDVDRTFGKIRHHAQCIVDLLTDQDTHPDQDTRPGQDTRLHLTSLLIKDGMTHEGAKQFIENLRLLASPPLSRLFDIPPQTPEARPPINGLRESFFIMLFKHHWDGPHPKGDQFIQFCVDQLALAGDHLSFRVVEKILLGIDRSRFSPDKP